ncbi:divalent-cation tolerance protein CutA [Chitinimonas viridis]|uniref:Divalent-cation tolerance protein CutA n=1 Tax=Chitinimonas viridis TaxID=664880 RepID=A0ABT8B574_9NEIS|nr:divalent-cation tolerance protein CutA [Chitinimonas viridis]MDN3576985.1 divalent-cation tolerance protein CutA [Chitinimonas viridis]
MADKYSVLVVLCNAPDEGCAKQLAEALIARQLAACVNLLAPATSLYRWEGRLETATEIPMLIKTTAEAYPALEATLQELHPYDTPEIIALPVVAGLPAYLGWVAAEVVA